MTKIMTALLLTALLCVGFSFVLLQYIQPVSDDIYDYSVTADQSEGGDEPGPGAAGWRFFLNEDGRVEPLALNSGGVCGGLEYNGQTFYFSRVLPASETPFPVLAFQLASQSVCVYLDDRLIYTNCPEDAGPIGSLTLPEQESDLYVRTALVSLPTDCAGKTLTVAQSTSPFGEIEGRVNDAIPCDITFYDGSAYETALISSTAKTLYPVTGLFVIGVILLIFFVYQTFQRRLDMGLFFIAAAVFICMTYLLIQSFLSGYYHLLSASCLEELCFYLCFIMLLSFLFIHMERRSKRVLGSAVFLQLLSVALFYLLVETNILPYGEVYVFLMFLPGKLFVLTLLTVIGLAAAEARAGSRFFRVFLYFTGGSAAGYLAFCLLTIPFGSAYAQSVVDRLGSALSSGVWTFPFLLSRNLLLLTGFATAIWDAATSLVRIHTGVHMLALKYEAAEDSYRCIRLQHDQIMMLRHDLNNHLAILDTFLKDGDYRRARDYLNEIVNQNASIPDIVNTAHDVLNIVLNSKLAAASDSGLQLKIVRAAAPAVLPLSDKDLCALIMNVLDNAIAGALASGAPESYINLDIHVKNNYFCFSCENSASGPVRVSAAKSGARFRQDFAPEEHGYGLRIIRHIVNKSGGIYQFDSDSTRFSVSFIIPLQ